ncbi:MAG: sensor histidine kinase [Eisenbergiella massiliensis]
MSYWKKASASSLTVNRLIEDIRIQDEKEKRSQLRALQAQINPHFIFNAMDMVNWLALSRNCDDIASIVSSIANMMRYSITNADSMVAISQEIANIREFISVYQLRHNNRLHLDTSVDNEDISITNLPCSRLWKIPCAMPKRWMGRICALTYTPGRKAVRR